METTVGEVDVYEFARATDAIASAFATDPGIKGVFGSIGEVAIRSRLADLFPEFFRVYETTGKVFIAETEDVVSGATIIHVPNYAPTPDSTRTAFEQAFYRHNPEDLLPVWREMSGAYGDIRDRSQYHLSVLGVHPHFQRRGVGTTILNHLLELVDSERQGIHLNTYKPENVVYYKRFGFLVAEERQIVNTACWHLKRPPQ